MKLEIITKTDLDRLKEDLIIEIRTQMKSNEKTKQWLRTSEVQKLLHVSSGTLHNMRSSGLLPYTTLGSIIYYDLDDIQKILIDNKKDVHESL